MGKFLRRAIPILMIAAFLFFCFNFFFLALAFGSSHNVPNETYMTFSWRCLGALLVLLLCWLGLNKMK